MKDKIIITGNIGDDSISILNKEYPYKVNTINLKKIKFEDGKFITDFVNDKLGPRDFCVNYNNNLLILNAYDESLITFDLERNVVISVVEVGRFPICMKIFDNKIYILNCDSNSISIMDEKSYIIIEEIYLDEKPSDLQIDLKEKKVYIANSNGNSLSVLDIDNNGIETIKLSNQPIRLIIDDSDVFILSYVNNGFINYSSISTLNKERKVIKNKNIKGIYLDFLKIDGDNFLLPNPEDGYLYNYKLSEDILSKRIFIGGMPCRIVKDNENNKIIYITDLINNQVVVLDYYKNKIITKINVGEDPQGIHLL